MKTVLRQTSRVTLLVVAALFAFAPSARAQLTINSGPNLGTWSIGMVDGVSLVATGGAPPYTWTILDNGSGGLLPQGLSIRTDIASYQQSQVPTPTAEIAGVALTAGSYSFRLRVTDSAAAFVDREFTMQISNLLLKDSFSLPDDRVGIPYSQQLHAIRKNGLNADPVTPTTWSLGNVSPASPPWLSLNSSGVLSGTPSAAGFYNAQIFITEGGETISRSVNIAVYDVRITSPTLLPIATQGVPYSTVVNADGGTGPYTFTATGLPSGMSITSGGGIAGTTTSVGPFRVTITATDSASHSRVQNATLDVVGSPKALPYFPSPAFLGDATYGWPFSNSLGISGGGTAPFTYSAAYRNAGDPNPPVAGLPAGLSIRAGDDPNGQSFYSHRDVEIWGVPVVLGQYEIFLTVTDADAASMTTMFPLKVGELIMSNNQDNNWTRGAAGDKKLRILGGSSVPAYGAPAPNGATLFSVVPVAGSPVPPAGIVLTAGCSQALAYCGTPTENVSLSTRLRFTRIVGPADQMDTSYFFSVGGGTSTIQINNGSNLGFVYQPNAYAFTLSACCTTNPLVWSFAGGAPPANLSINSVTGQLSAAANTMTTGTYTFEVRATDSGVAGNYGQRQFTLVVTNNNITSSTTLPFGNVGVAYGPAGGGVQLTSTSGGSTWTLNYGNVMPHGLTLDPTGLIHGTPTYPGQFRFAATVTGGASFTFSLSIYPAGATPPVSWSLSNQGPFPFGTRTQQFSSATGGSGTYVFSLAPGSPTVPGMRVQNGPPLPTSFSGSAAAAGLIGVLRQAGIFPFTIRAADAADPTNFIERSATLTVSPLHILSQFNLPRARWGASYTPLTLEPTGLVGSALWSATGLPAGMNINSGTGVLSGMPTGGPATATNSVNVTLTDSGTSQSIVVPFSLVINGNDILPASGTLPLGTINTLYPVQAFTTSLACGGSCSWGFSFSGLSAGTSPAGLTFNIGAGTLTGTPTANYNGTLTVTRNDSVLGNVSKIYALQIMNATPQTLVFTAPAATLYGTVGNNFSTTLSATGGSGSYAWSLDGLNPLPPGLAIYAAGDLISGTLSPSPVLAGHLMAPGTYTFTLRATDTVSLAFVKRTVTVVSSALNESYTNLPLSGSTLALNTAYMQELLGLGGSAAEGKGNYSWTATGILPYGLSLTSAGVLSGTPLEAGSFNVPIQLTDTFSLATLVLNVSINVSGSPVVAFGQSSTSPGTIQQGVGFSQALSFSGGSGPYTVTAVTPLPPGLTLVTGNSRLSGNLTDWFLVGNPLVPGTFTYTLRVQDSAGTPNVSYRTFTVVIAPFSLGVPTGLPDAAAGQPYSQTLQIWDALGPATWSVASGTSLPPGLNLAGNVLSGTPTLANNSYSFTLTATDASGIQRSTSFTLRVSNTALMDPSNPAVLDPQVLPVAIVGEPYTHTFTPVGGGAITWSLGGGLPAGLSFVNGVLSGTPTTQSSQTINVTASPAGGVAHTRRFVFSSRFPNPTVMDTQLANTALTDASVGQVTAFSLPIPFGGVPPYTWTLAGGSTLPAGLVLAPVSSLGAPIPNIVVNALGNFATVAGSTLLWGLPSAEGDYTFDLIATDSATPTPNTVRRTFSLHVSSLSLLGARGIVTTQPYAFQFSAIGGTAPYTYSASPVSFTQEMFPPGFAPSPLSSGGLLQGTTSSSGNYVFFLTVTDANGKTFKRRYSINSSNTTWFASLTNPTDVWAGSGRRSLFSLNVGGTGLPAAGWTWALAPGSNPLPPGIAIWTDPEVTGCDPASGCINGAALAGQPSVPDTYTFTLRATDNANSSNFVEHTSTWRVSPIQIVDPPVGAFVAPNMPYGHVGVPYTATLKMSGGVPPYHVTQSPFAPLPPGITISDAGVVFGTPTSVGSFFIAPVITDSAPTPNVLNGPALVLIVTQPGVPPPLAFLTTEFRNDASVGVPYAFSGDFLLRGGTAPFNWSLHPGATLPSGISLVAGGNGVPDHLVGIPATAGEYPFDLDIVDATGQTLTLHAGLVVSDVALTPDTLPPAKVGVPYSVNLTRSGGGGSSWVIQAHPNWDFPPGLTLSDQGVLSGTPTAPGNFPMIVVAYNMVGPEDAVFKLYRFAVDNAAGEAPAVSLAPTPIQVFHIVGSPNPAPISVAVNATTGGFDYSLFFEHVPMEINANLTSSSGTAPGATNLTLDFSGATTPGTYSGVLAVSANSVNLLDQIPVTITVASPPPCAYAVGPSSGSIGAAGGPGSFSVIAGDGCGWTADTTDAWITISAPASGAGSGPVNFSVAPNAGSDFRDGTITVQGHTYALRQFGSNCAFAINPTSVNAPAGGGSATVNVTASSSDPGCVVTASSADGLGVSPATAPAPGSGSVEITIPANGVAAPRDLHATIAGLDFVVHQASAACAVSLTPLEAAAASGGATGSVMVTTTPGCGYDSNGPGWVTVTSGGSGSGSGTLVYEVQPNSTTVQRIGTLTIGGQPFTITEEGVACSVTVDTNLLGSPYGKDGGLGGSVRVLSNGANCPWVAGSGAGWAHLSQTSGSGLDTPVNITLDPNASSPTSRSTELTVAGQVIVIVQSGVTCTYNLQSDSGSLPGVGGLGTVGVIAPSACPWSAVVDSEYQEWLSILSQGSQGTANILFSGMANPSTSASRPGTISILDAGSAVVKTYTVTQGPAPCTYTLGSSADTANGGGETKSFTYAATNGCTPTAVSYAGWLTNVTTGGGSVQYTVQPNPTTFSRKGTIQVGDQTFTVTQSSGTCGYSLNAYGISFSKTGGSGTLLAGQNPGACPATPIIGTTQPFITLLSLTGGPPSQWSQTYGVAVYSSLTATIRKGAITFGGQIFTVKQTSW